MPKLLLDYFQEGQAAYNSGMTLDQVAMRAEAIDAEADAALKAAYVGPDQRAVDRAIDVSENAIPSLGLGFFDGLVAAIRRIDAACERQ